MLFLSVYIGITLRFWSTEPTLGLSGGILVVKAISYAVVITTVMLVTGLYQRGQDGSYREQVFRLLWAFGLSLPLMTVLFYLIPSLFIGRGAFGLSFLLSLLGLLSTRKIFLILAGHEAIKRRVMVLGAGPMAAQIEQAQNDISWHGIEVVGYVPVKGETIVVDAKRLIKKEQRLFDLAVDYHVDEIVLALQDIREHLPMEDVLACRMRGIKVTEPVTFFEQWLGRIQIDAIRPEQTVMLSSFNDSWVRNLLKSSFDILVSLFIFAACLPIMLITTLAILVESGWPVFYSQKRVGKDGRVFTVYKFRSMVVDAEKDGAQFAAKNDARVTRVGRFIRATRIDELPQLLNVLRGEMSFVGPRPERPEFVQTLAKEIPYYQLRHRVKPGITGWAQICYPYGDSAEDAKQKLQFDLYYIKNYSLFLDVTILVQTAKVVLWNEGAR